VPWCKKHDTEVVESKHKESGRYEGSRTRNVHIRIRYIILAGKVLNVDGIMKKTSHVTEEQEITQTIYCSKLSFVGSISSKEF
jgi:hypothetical protein